MTEQWQDLKETITELRDNDRTGTQQEVCKFLVNYMEILEKQMQEPKTGGHWIDAKVGKMFPSNDYKCSECGNILDFDGVNCGRGDANFCPNCGARMESEGKNDNNNNILFCMGNTWR